MRWESEVKLSDEVRWRIGGAATRFGRVASVSHLVEALAELAGEPFLTLGWGANLLVADRGVTSPVLVLGDELDSIRTSPGRIEAGGAAGLPALVGEARRIGAEGWCFLEAVPGSIGGGLRMNAGSADTGIWDRVIEAEAVTPDGEIVRLTEAPLELAECFNDDSNTCPLIGVCRLSRTWHKALDAFLDVLDGVTIADIAGNRGELTQRLALDADGG